MHAQRDAGGEEDQAAARREHGPGADERGGGEGRDHDRGEEDAIEGDGQGRSRREANEDAAHRDAEDGEDEESVSTLGVHAAGTLPRTARAAAVSASSSRSRRSPPPWARSPLPPPRPPRLVTAWRSRPGMSWPSPALCGTRGCLFRLPSSATRSDRSASGQEAKVGGGQPSGRDHDRGRAARRRAGGVSAFERALELVPLLLLDDRGGAASGGGRSSIDEEKMG